MIPFTLANGSIWIDLGRIYTACWIEPIRSGSIQKPSVNGLLITTLNGFDLKCNVCCQQLICLLSCLSLQVSAHTGHSVTLVDLNNDLLTRAEQRIKGSLQRVAKKQFPDDQKVRVLFTRNC